MPGFAFPSVGPLGLGSPPSRSGLSLSRIIGTMLRYDCHLSVSVLFAFRCRSPIPLPCSHSFVSRFRLVISVGSHPMTPRLLFIQYPYSSGAPGGETFGSPKFPNCPSKRMPCSQTPVVSCLLAISPSGLLPSVSPTTSAFPVRPWLSFVHDHILFRGSISQPAFLRHSVPYFHCWFCTWISLLTCWLGFGQMGFELHRVSRFAPVGQC